MGLLRKARAKFGASLALMFGVLVFVCHLPSMADEPLSVRLTYMEYPPLIGEKLPYGGILTHIVNEALKLEDVSPIFEYVPNNRAITGVMMGMYDGGYGWSHSPERDQKLLYSTNSIYEFHIVLFHRRGVEYPWKTMTDLSKYRFGATLGDHYSDEFSDLTARGVLQVEDAATDLANMKKLLIGRIDLFPMEEEAGKQLLAASFSPSEQQRLTYQTTPFSIIPSYFVIRRTYPHAREIIERFDRGYRRLQESGRLPRLIEEARKETNKP